MSLLRKNSFICGNIHNVYFVHLPNLDNLLQIEEIFKNISTVKTEPNQLTIQAKRCPFCRRGQLTDRVPRAFLVKTILFFLPLKRYKCYNCGRKPYVFES